MNPILKTIGYVGSILCFIFGGLFLWYGIKPKTPTTYDYYWAEYWGQTIDEYFFEQMLFGIGIFIVFLFIGVGVIVGIHHYEKKQKGKTGKQQLERKTSKPEEDAITTLNLRYAKGEITKEEYEQMKKDIDGNK